ncbi:CBS domain-containing protein [Maioricimonas sp. JC845]|uniref:CBS domain-containing protein n=1 Tax=Maioricimonas sp. JC845 TaxID=3232138 RepID=UPI00345850DA
MSIGRICIREVDVINPDESARVAASRMHSRKVGTLIVVDEAMVPVGLLTDRDLTTRVLAEGRDGNATPVRKVMSPAPSTVEENTSIEDALAIMRSGTFRRLPVVDGEGQLVGIVSLDDILELLAEEFSEIGWLLRQEEPGSLAER